VQREPEKEATARTHRQWERGDGKGSWRRRVESLSTSSKRHVGGGPGSPGTSGGRGGCTMAASSSEEERGDGDLSRRQRCFSSFS
jgi:hypothetical protein